MSRGVFTIQKRDGFWTVHAPSYLDTHGKTIGVFTDHAEAKESRDRAAAQARHDTDEANRRKPSSCTCDPASPSGTKCTTKKLVCSSAITARNELRRNLIRGAMARNRKQREWLAGLNTVSKVLDPEFDSLV